MQKVIHSANKRGVAEHGWLHSRHSFSFAEFYDAEKMGFGLLRVLNDDVVEPGQGFGTHPHNNMEIISIVLDGALAHKDSMGSKSVINKDDVQVMSAGTGVTHSEFNASDTDPVNFLQLWIYPKEKNIKPRYDQKNFKADVKINNLATIVSGKNKNGSLYIHQNAEIDIALLEKGKSIKRSLSFEGNGMYIFVINGSIKIDDELLSEKDAMGLIGTEEITIEAVQKSRFIVIDVPMM